MAHPSVGSTLHPTHSQPGTEAVPSPTLHRALESLMVNLDDELLRYRHSRTGQGPSPVAQRKLMFRPKTARTAPSLIQLNSTSAQRSPSQRVASAAPQRSNPSRATAAPNHTEATGASLPSFSVQGPTATNGTLMPYVAAPDSFLESTAALLGSAPDHLSALTEPDAYYPESYYHEEYDHRPSLAQRLSTPLGMGALLLLLVGSAGFGYLVTSPTAIDHLRSHAWVQRFQPAPEPEAEAEATAPEAESSLPTGIQGIGPDLSGQDPDELDLDRVSRLPAEPSRRAAPLGPTAVVPNAAAPSAQPEAGEDATPPTNRPQPATSPTTGTLRTEPVAPLAPNRVSLPTTVAPSRVVPGPGQPRPQPRATQAPAAPRPTPAPVATAAPPAPVAPAAQPPRPLGTVTTRPTPAPTAAAPPPPLSPTASAPAARSTSYYVVTDYTGNQSLESARGVVGDAYVRDFQGSTKIQMGAFAQESSARDLVQQLQQQGIPAQVYNTP